MMNGIKRSTEHSHLLAKLRFQIEWHVKANFSAKEGDNVPFITKCLKTHLWKE